MIQSAFTRYINNYRGFSREIWILTAVTFINRAGTMVLPFLSRYLKDDLHFTLEEIGYVMVCFGLGSMLGSWLGGKLSDKIGFYKIMVFSLLTSGLLFFILQFITSFIGMCMAIFVIMSIADMFRPAMFVSLGVYSKPENRTRALALVRLAINLGFVLGPALGGIIIVSMGYSSLFWVDGFTCIIAIITFRVLVKEKKKEPTTNKQPENNLQKASVFKDKPYLLFLFACFAIATIFFQLFTTLPLYHKDAYGLTEFHTGLLMAINGLIVFLLEMPFINYIERKNISKMKILILGALLLAISFYTLLINIQLGILITGLILLTLGEMFYLPISSSFAMDRAKKGQEGRYMGVFAMAFSLAHIVSAKTGMEIISRWGYNATWLVMGTLGIMAVISLLLLQKMINKENS
ncbi:MAG: MFS transporter [Flavobacterium sp. MedPE-SWcel]|uniref:MDR family MFS transporter n=1 Tax=uncultured Flavobacterium sp. TaxID=165435 RepID=UPI0009109C5F|nr:MFS transporter [uncultured Flavobacterium sp.]OIQ18614.1 MAG: MFS transporter [Flavobacterium sp. MedPE-SWcel]